MLKTAILDLSLKILNLRLQLHPPGDNELTHWPQMMPFDIIEIAPVIHVNEQVILAKGSYFNSNRYRDSAYNAEVSTVRHYLLN